MNFIKIIFTFGKSRQDDVAHPSSLFGVSAREEKKIWKEITRKATEDQEKVTRKANAMKTRSL